MDHIDKVLVVDDEPLNCKLLANALESDYAVDIATSGQEALEYASADPPPDIILLDIMMPDIDGYGVCRQLKADEKTKHIPIIFITALDQVEHEAKGLRLGAVDYIVKPIKLPLIKTRVKNHLELKQYRDNLEHQVKLKTEEIRSGYIETICRLTLMAEYKDEETGEHIRRVSYFSKELASALGMSYEFCDTIFHASPMHDIGKVGIPDSILLKKGGLTEEEWKIMQSHTTIGGNILENPSSEYLEMAKDIALYHHEKWLGGGYPLGLRGDKIPLSARIMNIVDQYDALRSKRPYKPAFPHEKVVEIFTKGDGRTSPEDFEPQILQAFLDSAAKFAEIFETYS